MIPEQIQSKIYEQSQSNDQIPQDQVLNYENLEGNSQFIAKTGHWNNQQKMRYLFFIEYNMYHLDYKNKEQEIKVYKNMSGFIRTRRSHQCRYHHNKMLSYFGTISSTISFYQGYLPVSQNIKLQHQKDLEKYSLVNFIQASNIEEQPLINEKLQDEAFKKIQRRQKRKRTSIFVIDQKDMNGGADQKIIKTSQKTQSTLKCQSFDSFKVMVLEKGMSQSDKIKQEQVVVQQKQPDHLQKIFKINIQSAKTLQKHAQWLHCKYLYDLWRSKVEFLQQKQ